MQLKLVTPKRLKFNGITKSEINSKGELVKTLYLRPGVHTTLHPIQDRMNISIGRGIIK